MPQSKIWMYLVIIGIIALIAFLIGRATSPKTVAAPTVQEEKIAADDSSADAVTDTTETSSEPETPSEPEVPVIEDAPANSAPEALPVANQCYANDQELGKQLTLFAEKTERDSVWYVVHTGNPPDQLADCAGMFLRVIRFVQSTCDQYDYPKPTDARGSRTQARWFYDRNNLVIVKNGSDDAMAKRNLIKPGAVLFFGRSGQHYNDVTIDMIEREVAHVGVVTEVKRDDVGNVIGYTMFHGRSKGKIAQRSFYHSIEPPRLGFPILGNWNQQWMGIANIMTPKRSI